MTIEVVAAVRAEEVMTSTEVVVESTEAVEANAEAKEVESVEAVAIEKTIKRKIMIETLTTQLATLQKAMTQKTNTTRHLLNVSLYNPKSLMTTIPTMKKKATKLTKAHPLAEAKEVVVAVVAEAVANQEEAITIRRVKT